MLLWLAIPAAFAKSWCAQPLIAHEWGVQVLRPDGAKAVGTELPPWFHRSGVDPQQGLAVRDLPQDSGIRDLPVVQLYAPRGGTAIPFALEVGFRDGAATAWWPGVDLFVPASVAQSPNAQKARAELLTQRSQRDPVSGTDGVLPPDPTRQLGWETLSAGTVAPTNLRETDVAWVSTLREMPDALWIKHGNDSERFVFYEGTAPPKPALSLERGPTWSTTNPHYLLRNTSAHTAHDVVIVADGRSWQAPAIPAGATAGFLLDQKFDADAMLAHFRTQWSEAPVEDSRAGWDGECVMMRDPGVPVETASGHRVYPGEVDALLSVWGQRLSASQGVHLVYREDTAALDAAMPASLYTDMYHHIDWRRLGVTLVEGVKLP